MAYLNKVFLMGNLGKDPEIRIGTGRPEWGAEYGKQYFVITWEK